MKVSGLPGSQGLTILRIAIVLIASYAAPARALPTFDQVRQSHQPSDVRVLDRDGALLHRLRTDATVRRGDWVALADVSPALRTALDALGAMLS